jgi:hypothetical protein
VFKWVTSGSPAASPWRILGKEGNKLVPIGRVQHRPTNADLEACFYVSRMRGRAGQGLGCCCRFHPSGDGIFRNSSPFLSNIQHKLRLHPVVPHMQNAYAANNPLNKAIRTIRGLGDAKK